MQRIGQVGEGVAGGRGAGRAAHHLHADPEGLLAVAAAHGVHRRLEVRRPRQPRVSDGRQRSATGPKKSGIEHGVERRRAPGQGGREARREGHDLDDQLEQLGLGQEQRLDLHAGGQAARRSRAKRMKAGVRRAGGGGGLQQPRGQAGEQLAARARCAWRRCGRGARRGWSPATCARARKTPCAPGSPGSPDRRRRR